MLPFISALLFGLWFLFSYMFLAAPVKRLKPVRSKYKVSLMDKFELEKYQNEAEAIGWKITKSEFAIILIFALIITLAVSLITKNPLVIPVGFFTGVYLPQFLIEKKRKSMRMNIISKLTNPLRMLLSRIPDQKNITKAIETTRCEITNDCVRNLFDGYIKDISVGVSVKDALTNMKKKIKLKKFDIFVDNLIQAHYEGYTAEAASALNKSVEAIEFDLRAIEKVKEQSRQKKRNLYTALGITWFFPFILSVVSSGNSNVYLNTIQGKALILFYITGTIYVFVKGEEYLSLNLDEL